jgi:hypothetical protein
MSAKQADRMSTSSCCQLQGTVLIHNNVLVGVNRLNPAASKMLLNNSKDPVAWVLPGGIGWAAFIIATDLRSEALDWPGGRPYTK